MGQTRNSAPAKRAPLWIHTVQRVLPVHRNVRALYHSIDVLLLVLVQLVRVGSLVDQRLALVVLELLLLSLSNLPTGRLDDIDCTVVADDAQAGVVDVKDKDGLGHGRGDDDADDDIKVETLNPVVPSPGKIVVGEEATGTWCGWCPRGAVFLEQMANDYSDHFVGVAVHNGDPMTVDTYDEAIGGFISGYPSMLVDRGADIDPSDVEGAFLDRIVIGPKAVLTVGSDYVDGATSMNVSVTADFVEVIASS